jgi:hypothetical protein
MFKSKIARLFGFYNRPFFRSREGFKTFKLREKIVLGISLISSFYVDFSGFKPI